MQSRKRSFFIAATFLALLAVAWWWLQAHNLSTDPRLSTSAAPGDAAATSGSTPPAADTDSDRDANMRVTPLPPPSRPLPPDNTPLAEIFDELKARADAGDAHAACRLAVDLLDCGAIERDAPRQLDRMQRRETNSDTKGDLAEANRYAELQGQVLAARQRCARIDANQIAMAGDYLRRSAKAGVPEAMLRYASGQGFGSDSPLSALRDPGFDAWRREAPAMMQASLRDGRPEAVAMLSEAYRNDDTLLFSALVPNDAMQARAYLVLHQWLLGKNAPADTAPVTAEVLAQMKAAGIDTRSLNPTPDQMRQADAEADRLYQSYFGGQPLTDKRAIGRWLNVGPLLSSTDRPAEPPRCH